MKRLEELLKKEYLSFDEYQEMEKLIEVYGMPFEYARW